MPKGLNAAAREVIRGMIMAGESGEAVRDMIDRLVDSYGWDFPKNLQFVRELAANGYSETARHLARKISD